MSSKSWGNKAASRDAEILVKLSFALGRTAILGEIVVCVFMVKCYSVVGMYGDKW